MYENVFAARRQVNRQFGYLYPKLFLFLLLLALVVGCNDSLEEVGAEVALASPGPAAAAALRVARVNSDSGQEQPSRRFDATGAG